MSVNGLGLNIQTAPQSTVSKTAGVDLSQVSQVTSEIFGRAQSKSVNTVDLTQVNLNQFRRAELGVDLYSGKTNVDLQKQISLTQAGQLNNANVINSAAFLNTQAAAQVYSPSNIQKNVEGKLFIQTNQQVDSVKEIFALPNTAMVFKTADLDKDKKGSNPFSFTYSSNGKKDEKAQVEGLNIFA